MAIPRRASTAPTPRPVREAFRRELFLLMAWAFGIAAVTRWALSPYGTATASWGAATVAGVLMVSTTAAYRVKLSRARRHLAARGVR